MSEPVLLIGGEGQLGRELQDALRAVGVTFLAPSIDDLDITNPEHIAKIIVREFGTLTWCVNCAAYTAVDQAETDVDACLMANSYGPSLLAKACATTNIRPIHLSTDFVFDGAKRNPYIESDDVAPIGVYARSKAQGESNVMEAGGQPLVFRTSWLFGKYGKNFPRTIVRAHRAGKSLRVVNDQIGTPTSAEELAKVIVQAMQREIASGLYHAAGPDIMSWYELAQMSLAAYYEANDLALPADLDLIPCSSEDWPTPAKRPPYSALDSSKLYATGVEPMKATKSALIAMFQSLGENI